MAPFFLQRRGGAGSGRVFAFASIANQPHTFENRYVPGSGVGASSISNRRALSRRATYIRKPPVIPTLSGLLSSKNNVNTGGFTIGQNVDKDMKNEIYTYVFNPTNFLNFFPNMTPCNNVNIIVGDKHEADRLIASYWEDLGDDVFDFWGFFYLYDVNSGKYYFPIIDSQDNVNGIFATQIFYVFGRVFTVVHGWAVRGIFKFDISVADNLPFRFGAYGNMGSDGDEFTEEMTQNYSINGKNLTLYYHHDQEDGNNKEQLFSYWIPKKISENSSRTYNVFYNNDNMSMLSNDVTTGLIVYFAKSNDVKDWVINDLAEN